MLNQLDKTVANPGSTLGEAVGALIEREVNRLLRPLTEENDCVYLSAGRINPRTGKATKLLLRDEAGNDYNIDAVIANAQMQPLILIESKYIRYKNTIATKVLGSAPHIIVCGEPFHPCENQSP